MRCSPESGPVEMYVLAVACLGKAARLGYTHQRWFSAEISGQGDGIRLEESGFGSLQEVEVAALDHDCTVALQAHCELVAAATRKGMMTIEQAGAQVSDWQALVTTVYPAPGSLPQAIDAVAQHNLSFWDATMWSVVKDSGGTVLLSEDLQDSRALAGVRFRSPFAREDPFRFTPRGRTCWQPCFRRSRVSVGTSNRPWILNHPHRAREPCLSKSRVVSPMSTST